MAKTEGVTDFVRCNRLKEVALAEGVPAYLISGPEELQESWFDGISKVGVTSGASTPEASVQRVIGSLSPAMVTQLDVIAENVTFSLPKELTTPK